MDMVMVMDMDMDIGWQNYAWAPVTTGRAASESGRRMVQSECQNHECLPRVRADEGSIKRHEVLAQLATLWK
jgi:hypothetical protein